MDIATPLGFVLSLTFALISLVLFVLWQSSQRKAREAKDRLERVLHDSHVARAQGVDHPIPPDVLRKAEDGSEVLYAISRHLRIAGANSYAEQIRHDAEAIRQFTATHPEADLSEPDSPEGAGEHATQLRFRLGINPE